MGKINTTRWVICLSRNPTSHSAYRLLTPDLQIATYCLPWDACKNCFHYLHQFACQLFPEDSVIADQYLYINNALDYIVLERLHATVT
jgi:hypothetical protein